MRMVEVETGSCNSLASCPVLYPVVCLTFEGILTNRRTQNVILRAYIIAGLVNYIDSIILNIKMCFAYLLELFGKA